MKKRRRHQVPHIRVYIWMLLSIIPWLSEGWRDEILHSGCAARAYQYLVTRARPPRVKETVIIEIDPSKEFPGVQASCEAREFLAELLTRLAKATPSVIVLDKWFVPHICGDNTINANFVATIQQLRQSGRPVVL